jgi:hypothetical protein
VYICASCIAFGCSTFAVFMMSDLLVFLYDLEGSLKKEHFAVTTIDICRLV